MAAHDTQKPRSIVTGDGIDMACDIAGQGEPLLLFIHGWTCRRSYWQPQIDHFGTTRRVAAIDLPGHGGTPAGDRVEWTISTLADDVATATEVLGAGRAVMIGHSMGGAVALEAARRIGHRAAGVILVDTFVIDYGGLPAERQEEIAAPFAADFPAAIAGLVEQTSTAATPPALRERLGREMAAADPAWALPLWRDLLSWDPASAFAELKVPIHAINGALIPDSARERCAPHVTESVIPGAGHFLQMEDPGGFNRELERILPRLAA